MEKLIQYYFKKERIQQGISIETLSTKSRINDYLITRYENSREQQSEDQSIKLFKVLGLNYLKVKNDFCAMKERISLIYGKIFFYDLSYIKDFENLKKEFSQNKISPSYFHYLILEMFITYRDSKNFEIVRDIVDDYFELLSIGEKQIYYIAVGSFYEYKNDLKEALDICFQARELNITDNMISSHIEEKISILYQKLFVFGKAVEYCSLAKKHYKEQENLKRLAHIYNHEGLLFMKMKNYEESNNAFQEALSYMKMFSINFIEKAIINNLIMLNMYQKNYKKMLEFSEQLLKFGGIKCDVYFYKAWAYYNLNEEEAAYLVLGYAKASMEDDLKTNSLILMVEALLNKDVNIEEVLKSTLGVMINICDVEMIYFVIDMLIEHLYNNQQFEECCQYFLIKQRYMDGISQLE